MRRTFHFHHCPMTHSQLQKVKVCPEAMYSYLVAYLNSVSADWQGSVTSKLTSSDKLGALPLQLEGFRTGRTSRGSSPRIESHSLPSLFSPSASPPALNTELAHVGPSRHATLSEGSLGKDPSRHRVSFDSDRASPTPAPYPNARQGVYPWCTVWIVSNHYSDSSFCAQPQQRSRPQRHAGGLPTSNHTLSLYFSCELPSDVTPASLPMAGSPP